LLSKEEIAEDIYPIFHKQFKQRKTVIPKSKKWIDGKNLTLWPIAEHVGWSVQTAGYIDLDEIYPLSGAYNYTNERTLPPKTVAVLKDIDPQGRAYLYNDRHGVLMMPAELLEPVGR
jgi:hypothetical protein